MITSVHKYNERLLHVRVIRCPIHALSFRDLMKQIPHGHHEWVTIDHISGEFVSLGTCPGSFENDLSNLDHQSHTTHGICKPHTPSTTTTHNKIHPPFTNPKTIHIFYTKYIYTLLILLTCPLYSNNHFSQNHAQPLHVNTNFQHSPPFDYQPLTFPPYLGTTTTRFHNEPPHSLQLIPPPFEYQPPHHLPRPPHQSPLQTVLSTMAHIIRPRPVDPAHLEIYMNVG